MIQSLYQSFSRSTVANFLTGSIATIAANAGSGTMTYVLGTSIAILTIVNLSLQIRYYAVKSKEGKK